MARIIGVAVLSVCVLLGVSATVVVRTHAGSDGARPSPPPTAALAPVDARATGVSAALARMTRGLQGHDEATFLAAVNPRDTALIARQRQLFRSLQALPLKQPELSWDGSSLRRPTRTAGLPAGAVVVLADLRYLLDGWDDERVADGMVLTMAPSGATWLVVGDSEQAGDADSRYLEPWSTGGRLVVEKRAHVLVVGEASHRTELRRLADRLERVSVEVRALWPEPSWNGKTVAYAVTDKRFVDAWFAGQAATGPARDRPGAEPTWEARVGNLDSSTAAGDLGIGPPRLVVTPYVLARKDTRVLSTLRHEVTHVATARAGRPVPGWLAEGTAEYTGFRLGKTKVDALRTFMQHGLTTAALQQMRKGSWRPRLVADREGFYTGTAAEVAAGYLDGWIACLYVADRYGDARLRRLYDAAASQPAGASWDAVEASALRSVLGTDRAGFVQAVRRYGIGLYRTATTPS
jgi:hypothetical protein